VGEVNAYGEMGNSTDLHPGADSKQRLVSIVDAVISSYRGTGIGGEDAAPFPSRRQVIEMAEQLLELLLPGRPGDHEVIGGDTLEQEVRRRLSWLFEMLSLQISLSMRHGCMKVGKPCGACEKLGQEKAVAFLERIPHLREVLAGDIEAAFDRDPAAKSLEEVVLSYPGVVAIAVYRLAHELWLLEVPFVPRMMTEHAHRITGIDIHPGATIGSDFFIDHGTGVVIGESTEIGDHVTIYQGVTLGGYRFRTAEDGSLERGYKRHPTVGDHVIIYAGATILGGDTVIGARSIIGGSVWLTHSVPGDAVVTIKDPNLKYKVGY
jgi:serine O-acetyltransferase